MPVLDEQDMLEEWAHAWVNLPADDERVGHWRNLEYLWHPSVHWKRKEGLMVLNGAKWDLYFNLSDDFDHTKMCERLIGHPFVNNCSYEPTKGLGQWKVSKAGKNTWFPDFRLSEKDIGLKTNNNVSCTAGCSKHEDGPAVGGKLMTHAWM